MNIDFTARYISGELRTSDESTDVIWTTAEKAMEMIVEWSVAYRDGKDIAEIMEKQLGEFLV